MAEKDQMEQDEALHRIRTAGSITITPELFEKLYLSPQNQVKGDLRLTFANPTPIALGGFLLALSPLSCQLMGWQGVLQTVPGTATIGTYYSFGGICMLLGGLGEWILGNTFPAVVFITFSAFWLTFGMTNQDNFYGAIAAYAKANMTEDSGLSTPGFAEAFGFFLVFMGVLCFVYLLCSIRTNVIFFLIFLFLVPAFGCLSAAFYKVRDVVKLTAAQDAAGAAAALQKATDLQTAGGALAFVVSMLGWYIFSVIMLASVDFPLELPLGDLSTVIKGASERKKAKGN